MTSWRHSLSRWFETLFSAVSFEVDLYEAILFFIQHYIGIFPHDVNFDVTIMTSFSLLFGWIMYGFLEETYLGIVTNRVHWISQLSKVKSNIVSLSPGNCPWELMPKQHKSRVLAILQRRMTWKQQQPRSYESRRQDGGKTKNGPPDLLPGHAILAAQLFIWLVSARGQ